MTKTEKLARRIFAIHERLTHWRDGCRKWDSLCGSETEVWVVIATHLLHDQARERRAAK